MRFEMKTHISILPLILAMTVACNREELSKPISGDEAAVLAEAYMQKAFPQYRSKRRGKTLNGGKSWVVPYHPPENALGGTSFVVIHKQTREIVAEFGGQ
jgi:hypothetical protein